MKVLIPLAEGFEEIEAITIIDILRRAGIEIISAALSKNPVTGAHKIQITADTLLDGIISSKTEFTAIVLPGGMPGSAALKNDRRVIDIIQNISRSGALTAAICAAPIALAAAGVLNGKRYTCFPGYEKEITGAVYSRESVVIDGNVITSIGAGCAPLFALAVIEFLKGKPAAEKVKDSLIAFW